MRKRAEPLLYVATFLLLATLGGWWTVLILRLVEENHALQMELSGPTPAAVAHYERQRFMLVGESVMLSTLVLALAGFIARQGIRERAQARRLEGILAASTHELKTPVAGVRLLLESLQAGVLTLERAGPHLEKGLEACDRLEHTIESILAYQAAVVRGHVLDARPLKVWLQPVLDHRLGEPVDVDLGAAGDARVRGAADPFRVVIENLLDNARKYGGGQPVRIRGRLEPGWAHLDVADDGPGFDPADAEMLFEPYQRGRAGGHGSGLGLYIARSLARGMQGDLRARSDGPGRGATFTLSLRAAES